MQRACSPATSRGATPAPVDSFRAVGKLFWSSLRAAPRPRALMDRAQGAGGRGNGHARCARATKGGRASHPSRTRRLWCPRSSRRRQPACRFSRPPAPWALSMSALGLGAPPRRLLRNCQMYGPRKLSIACSFVCIATKLAQAAPGQLSDRSEAVHRCRGAVSARCRGTSPLHPAWAQGEKP